MRAYGDSSLELHRHAHDGFEDLLDGVGAVAIVGGDDVEALTTASDE